MHIYIHAASNRVAPSPPQSTHLPPCCLYVHMNVNSKKFASRFIVTVPKREQNTIHCYTKNTFLYVGTYVPNSII